MQSEGESGSENEFGMNKRGKKQGKSTPGRTQSGPLWGKPRQQTLPGVCVQMLKTPMRTSTHASWAAMLGFPASDDVRSRPPYGKTRSPRAGFENCFVYVFWDLVIDTSVSFLLPFLLLSCSILFPLFYFACRTFLSCHYDSWRRISVVPQKLEIRPLRICGSVLLASLSIFWFA